MKHIALLILCLISINTFSQNNNEKVINLKCEYISNPVGIDIPNPVFSWNIKTDLS